MKNLVKSFEIDHRTLRAGIYLRSELYQTKSWDVRLVAPSEHRPLTPGAMHVIEHVMAQRLRETKQLAGRAIAVCPMGCLTGLYIITTASVTMMDIVEGFKNAANVFPLDGIEQVPGMNEVQCGNPGLNDIPGANRAIRRFLELWN